MTTTGITDEDFVNYRIPSMFISAASCTFKCEKESGIRCCQNNGISDKYRMKVDDRTLVERYGSNPITNAIVFGGLEPIDQINEIDWFLRILRFNYGCNDPVVIYTGYDEGEIIPQISKLKKFTNIIVKFGRYIPGQQPHYDEVLGVNLASDNQYAVKIS